MYEAILELVNQKIEAKYNAMSDEDKQAYREVYNQIKANLEKNSVTQDELDNNSDKKED